MPRRDRAHLVRVFPPAPHGGPVVTPFDGTRIVVGASPDCAVPVPGAGLDAEHVRLERPRSGAALRVQDLDSSTRVFADGVPVPARGADLPVGGVLRVGGAVFLHLRWTDEEGAAAALPPLPGPVNSCSPVVLEGLRRLQRKRFDAGTFWICGPSGAGRSVVIDHLRALTEESSGGDWITGGAAFEPCPTAPPHADPERTIVLPPLARRREDLLVLLAAMNGGALPPVSPTAVEGLLLYDWPGNIRELRLALARAHDPRFGAAPGESWERARFADCDRWVMETVGGADPVTVQARRPLPPLARDMRVLLDGHDWRIHAVAAATGRSRADVLDHVFSLGIREPWERS